VYHLQVTNIRRVQINNTIYSVFRLTQHNYTTKVNSFGLFTGHHQTYTLEYVRHCTILHIAGPVYIIYFIILLLFNVEFLLYTVFPLILRFLNICVIM